MHVRPIVYYTIIFAACAAAPLHATTAWFFAFQGIAHITSWLILIATLIIETALLMWYIPRLKATRALLATLLGNGISVATWIPILALIGGIAYMLPGVISPDGQELFLIFSIYSMLYFNSIFAQLYTVAYFLGKTTHELRAPIIIGKTISFGIWLWYQGGL